MRLQSVFMLVRIQSVTSVLAVRVSDASVETAYSELIKGEIESEEDSPMRQRGTFST